MLMMQPLTVCRAMVTELMRVPTILENEECPPVPPGFESFSSMTTKGVNDELKEGIKQEKGSLMSPLVPSVASEPPQVQIKMEVKHGNAESTTRSLRRRTWVKNNQYDCSWADDSDCEKVC